MYNKNGISQEVIEEWKRFLESDEYRHNPECGTLLIAQHFAEWGKEQMMKDAITAKILPANLDETEFCLDDYDEVNKITALVKEGNLKIGDKVQMIIVKEE